MPLIPTNHIMVCFSYIKLDPRILNIHIYLGRGGAFLLCVCAFAKLNNAKSAQNEEPRRQTLVANQNAFKPYQREYKLQLISSILKTA